MDRVFRRLWPQSSFEWGFRIENSLRDHPLVATSVEVHVQVRKGLRSCLRGEVTYDNLPIAGTDLVMGIKSDRREVNQAQKEPPSLVQHVFKTHCASIPSPLETLTRWPFLALLKPWSMLYA